MSVTPKIFAFPGSQQGMTLRDYFAAQAITGAVTGEVVQQEDLDEMARSAYSMADAMLRAREI